MYPEPVRMRRVLVEGINAKSGANGGLSMLLPVSSSSEMGMNWSNGPQWRKQKNAKRGL